MISIWYQKAALLLRTIMLVRSWPGVLVRWFDAHFRHPESTASNFQVVFRDGATIWCRPSLLGTWPVFEVLIADAYRVGHLRRLLPELPTALIDVGAHVGLPCGSVQNLT